MQKKFNKIFGKIGSLVYPAECPMCGNILKENEKEICDICKCKIPYIGRPNCLRCGKEIEDDAAEYCFDCSNHEHSYIRGFPALNYDDAISKSMMEFKYKNKRKYAKFFATEIIRNNGSQILGLDIDALVPIPIHKLKYRKRGYNQAEILANELAGRLDIPVDNDLLVRRINTLSQKNLNNIEREKNLIKAFSCTEKVVEYKSVMLVDDIYTTGATINACAKILKTKGIFDIYYTSVCIGKGV